MQELVQWCRGSDRLTTPESLPIQSKVITLSSERGEAKENCPMLVVQLRRLRGQAVCVYAMQGSSHNGGLP